MPAAGREEKPAIRDRLEQAGTERKPEHRTLDREKAKPGIGCRENIKNCLTNLPYPGYPFNKLVEGIPAAAGADLSAKQLPSGTDSMAFRLPLPSLTGDLLTACRGLTTAGGLL